MPEEPRFAVVQAHYLLAAAAFTVADDTYYGGIKIERHPGKPGAIVSSTTGKHVAAIYDGHGTTKGPASFWLIPAKTLAKELKKIEEASAKYFGDIWALMTWTGSDTGSIQLIEADNGAQALDGNGKLIKTMVRDSSTLVIEGQVPATLANIRGATAVSRDFAPSYWFMPHNMARLGEFAQAITNSTRAAPAGIAFLRTKRESTVQVAFRDHDEAAVFLATIKSDGQMRSDNPGWLDSLL